MAKILKFEKIEKEHVNMHNKAIIIPFNKNITSPLTIKEWKQKYLDKNSKFKTLHIFVSAVGASLLLDKLLIPWEDMPDYERSRKENLLGILYDQLEKFESVKNKENPVTSSFHVNYKEKYFSDFKINIQNDEKMSVLYLDMIMLLLTKMFDNVCYVKQLVEEVEDGINKIYVKDCIDINYSSCIINPKVINNKFMFRFTFLSDWSRKRGVLKKLNKKSILNFVNKLDSNHIFLY